MYSCALCVDKTEKGGNSDGIPSPLESERMKDYANSQFMRSRKGYA